MPTRYVDIPVGTVKSFVVTGVDTNGKRFVKSYKNGESGRSAYQTAMMINLYKGSVWAELDSGKRKLLKRVIN